MNQPIFPRLLFAALLLAIAAAWLPRLWAAPFHEDEAIYAAWSRQILRGDPWLSVTPIDKPPLTFYPIAASLALFGEHECAARLPNLFWTALKLAALWRIATQRGLPGGLAVLLALWSPLLWTMAASAFTDPPMVALAFWAIAWGMERRPGWSGAAMGLAFLAKPTALLLAPLVLLAFWRGDGGQTSEPAADDPSPLQRFVLAGAAPVLLAWAWDASRAAPSWWALGAQAYGSLGVAGGEIGEWGLILAQSLGPLALFLVVVFITARAALTPLALYLVAWVPLHILLGFRPWERYLLPLVPICALWLAGFMDSRIRTIEPPRRQERQENGAIYRKASSRGTPSPAVGRGGGGVRAVEPQRRRGRRERQEQRTSRNEAPPPLAVFGGEGWGVGAAVGAAALAVALTLLAPALVQPLQLEPHDGRWAGIEAIGDAVEALPAEAVVYYLDAGRPLAWYARDARAPLSWGGPGWPELRSVLAARTGESAYLVARVNDPLLSHLPGRETIRQSADFGLFLLPTTAPEP